MISYIKRSIQWKPVGAADSCINLTDMTKGHTEPQAEYSVTSN